VVTSAVVAAAAILVACGNVSTDAGSSVEIADAPAPADLSASNDVGTAGELIAIDSDNVFMAGYSQSTRVMTVLFRSGGLYEYYDVPPELWQAFVDAQPDPWSLVGYPQLVQQNYAYRKISS
jgi:hypothetical protein